MRGRLAVSGIALLSLVEIAGAREWTDATGQFRVEAELISAADGIVRLKKASGAIISVPVNKLSDTDREFVKQSQLPPIAVQPATQPVAPELAKQFLQQVFFKNAGKIRELLAQEPALVNCEHNFDTPLISACRTESLEIVQLLLEKGADPKMASSSGNTPILDAVMRKNVKVVAELLAKGVSPTAANAEGYTPLHRAATKEVAELLLSLDGDVAARTKNGDTPLHTALSMGYLEVAELLLDRGADIEAIGNFDHRPLHVATRSSFGDGLAMVNMLLAKGVNVQGRGFIDNTVVHEAAFHNKPDLIELFIKKGVDVNTKNRNNQTALDLAKQSSSQAAIDLLKSNGATE